jgi:hypothetical protein
VSPVDQAVIDLVAGAAVWRVPGFEVDSFVHEIRALDRHLSADFADQSEAVCTIMQAVSPNSRFVYCFPPDSIITGHGKFRKHLHNGSLNARLLR